MRIRNPKTGTTLSVGDEAAKRYLAQGWEKADGPPSTSGGGETRTRRRRTTSSESE